MKKSSRDKLAEGIISKLIDKFYSKKAKAYTDLMIKADPEIGSATKQLQKSTKNLHDKLVQLNKKKAKWFKDNNIRVDSEGTPNIDDLKAHAKRRRN